MPRGNKSEFESTSPLNGNCVAAARGARRARPFEVPERDAALAQVVRRQLQRDVVARQDADMVLAHAPGRVGHRGCGRCRGSRDNANRAALPDTLPRISISSSLANRAPCGCEGCALQPGQAVVDGITPRTVARVETGYEAQHAVVRGAALAAADGNRRGKAAGVGAGDERRDKVLAHCERVFWSCFHECAFAQGPAGRARRRLRPPLGSPCETRRHRAAMAGPAAGYQRDREKSSPLG